MIEGKLSPTPAKEISKFSSFTDRYLNYSKANKRAYGVEECYVRATLKPFFGDYRLNQISALMVEEFKQKRLRDGLKKSSINREVGLLKSMLSIAVRWELIDKNGARDCTLFKLDDPQQDRVLSFDEEVKLLAACDRPELKNRASLLKPIILVALYTGLRRGEILRLRWKDIDFDRSMLVVREAKTPAGQGRWVNINSRLRAALLALREDARCEWLFPSPDRFQEKIESERHLADVKHGFHRAVNLAGIAPITFHHLRHTFCTRLAKAGVPLPVIQELARHASIIMTRRYTHPAIELKQKAVELLLADQNQCETATKPATAHGQEPKETIKPKRQVIQFRRARLQKVPNGHGREAVFLQAGSQKYNSAEDGLPFIHGIDEDT